MAFSHFEISKNKSFRNFSFLRFYIIPLPVFTVIRVEIHFLLLLLRNVLFVVFFHKSRTGAICRVINFTIRFLLRHAAHFPWHLLSHMCEIRKMCFIFIFPTLGKIAKAIIVFHEDRRYTYQYCSQQYQSQNQCTYSTHLQYCAKIHFTVSTRCAHRIYYFNEQALNHYKITLHYMIHLMKRNFVDNSWS